MKDIDVIHDELRHNEALPDRRIAWSLTKEEPFAQQICKEAVHTLNGQRFHNVHPKNCIGKLDRISKFCHILQGRVESLRFPSNDIDANNARADLLEVLHRHTSMRKDFMHTFYILGERTMPMFYTIDNVESFFWRTELGYARESFVEKERRGMHLVMEELSKVHAANATAMEPPMDFRLVFARIFKANEETNRIREDQLMKMG